MAQREKELDERYQLINEGGFLYNKLLIELFIIYKSVSVIFIRFDHCADLISSERLKAEQQLD